LKIDIYSHILPEKYLTALRKGSQQSVDSRETRNRAVVDIETRLRVMDRYPDVLQVLTVSLPPLDVYSSPGDAREISRIANDELAELVVKYPDKFIAAVACLPLNDMDAALEEADRAITQLGLKGVQIFARLNSDNLGDAKYFPLYEKMVNYNLPIWIHPYSDENDDITDAGTFGWPVTTSINMQRLVVAGVFHDYPDIKFITHHCGGIAPLLEGRLRWLFPRILEPGHPAQHWVEHFHKFYADTATYGSTDALMCGYDYFGVDRLLFGTDAPLGPDFGLTQETVRSIERMDIPDSDKGKIFLQNAVNLLSIAL
jgi:aminocarboxymuconate-semialdehyde decarboxylase